MAGNITLTASGGRPGDIWLDLRNPTLSQFEFVGRVLATDGSPRSGVLVRVLERRSLVDDVLVASGTTDARGAYAIRVSLPGSASGDLLVQASDGVDSVVSPLRSDLDAGTHHVDLVLGVGSYAGRSEWERLAAKLSPLLGSTAAQAVPSDRLEWLALRADVFPLHLAAYVQAHRLAEGRSVEAATCYACIRAGLPSDLPGLLRVGEPAWAGALLHAWSRRILPQPGDGSDAARDAKVAEQVDAMRELVVAAALESRSGASTTRAIFDTAALTAAEQEEFMTAWVGRTSLSAFWATIEASPTLGSAKAALFQFTIQAAVFVGNHVPALAGLQAERSASTITHARDLAAWAHSDWDAFLVARSVTPPDAVPGSTATQKRQNYARMLERVVEDAYPTLSLRHRIARDEGTSSAPAHTAELVGFFDDNPDFDITRTVIARHVSENPSAFAGASNPALARANLELVARVHRISPRLGRYDTVKVLLDRGIASARDVVARTRSEFVDALGPFFGGEHHEGAALAGRVWDRASKVDGMTTAMVSMYALSRASVGPAALAGVGQWSLESGGLESLDDIFASLDYCACTECRSVLSPAAYLADLLQFLAERPSQVAGQSALDQLELRRPDLGEVLLDCANTNTPLPVIDLVNEVLEAAFVGPLSESSARQTTWSAGELALHPEHLDAAVYEGSAVGPAQQLTEMVFPWRLPFSLPELEADRHLARLGVDRARLMTLLATASGPSTSAIVAADLHVSPAWHAILSGTYAGVPSGDGRQYWGFAASSETDGWVGILAGTDVEHGDLGELLRRAEISLAELEVLIDLTFIDPLTYAEVGPIVTNYAESCQLADAQLLNLDAAALGRLHRFVRLARATAIPWRMLNVLIDDLGGVIDAGFLAKLVDIRWLHDELRVEWDELASWWAPRIDARLYDQAPASLYRRRFQAPELAAHADFAPNPRGDALFGEAVEPPPLTEAHLPTLLAGTGLSADERKAIAQAGLAGSVFTFLDITKYFRVASLARALRVTVAELIRLLALTGIDPFASPSQTRQLVTTWRSLRASGFGLRELDDLLRHDAVLAQESGYDARAAMVLGQLALGLHRIIDEVELLVDESGEALAANLALRLEPDDLVDAMAIVRMTSETMSEAQQGEFVDEHFASFTDPALARTKLVTGGGELLSVVDRHTWLLREFLRSARTRALVVDTFAAQHQLDARACEVLLDDVLTEPGETRSLMALFVEDHPTQAAVDLGLTRDVQASWFAGWDRLRKAALVVRRFRIAPAAIGWYSGHAGWLDLDALPLSDGDPDVDFASWDRMRLALELRALFPADVLGHQALVEAPSLAAALERLATSAGWDVSSVDGLGFVAEQLDWTSPTLLDDERNLARLRDIAELVELAGVSAATLWSWVHGSLDLALTASIKQATRAHYDEASWPAVARPLRNAIREQQRDALVDALLAAQPGVTRKQLADALLIDLDMSACMLTSRIKQAIGAVQTFVNRAQLGLEPNVVLDAEDAERWAWTKHHRVWEANRKVFLYPENWLEPSLRRDKTPEFAQLEASLLQNELDDDHVEQALIRYVERLDALAKLEIVSTFASGDSLWVLGREQATPRKYYVRQRSEGRWSPWEEVPLPIEGDNVVLVHRGVRTYLFWLVRADSSDPATAEPSKSLRFESESVGLCWSELGHSGWSEQRASSRVLLPKLLPSAEGPTLPPTVYLLKTINTSPLIELRAYMVREGLQSWPFQQFFYDPSVKRVILGGLGQTLQGRYAVNLNNYDVEGQRFEAEGFVDVNYDGVIVNGTTFRQGPFAVELFRQTKKRYKRGFVHQSDAWQTSNYWTPQFFDNHDLKYLIVASPANDKPNVEGPDLQPIDLLGVDWSSFGGIVLDAVLPADESMQANLPALQDGLLVAQPWQGASPGFQVALAPFVKVLGLGYVGQGQAQQVMDEGAAMMGASKDYLPAEPNVEPDASAVRLRLEPFHHPFTDRLVRAVNLYGVKGIYEPRDAGLLRQAITADPLGLGGLDVNTDVVLSPRPIDEFDFSSGGAYAAYNWELFVHAPLLIADKLMSDQRHAEAQRWLHAIFNPLQRIEGEGESASSPAWRARPLVAEAKAEQQAQLEAMLGIGVTPAEQHAATLEFTAQVEAWLANPFDPYAIARVRPGAIMRAVFMRYLDNLLAWGDQLFRRDTIESITEATILYGLVAELLGPRPNVLPEPASAAMSYHQLAEGSGLDAFGNAKVQLESWLYLTDDDAELLGEDAPSLGWKQVPLRFWYFCYPPNAKLLEYWDRVADRLWKIQHCRNIDGIARQLPLFDPPLDPALLIAATAAGVDLGAILQEVAAGLPPYRFRHVLAKAMDFTAELRGLGNALLGALEKRDGEALGRLRAQHERSLLEAIREVRVQQVVEARTQLDAIRTARAPIALRRSFYQGLVEGGLDAGERENLDELGEAAIATTNAHGARMMAGLLGLIPNLMVGTGAFSDFGGQQLSTFAGSFAEVFAADASLRTYLANRALTNSQYRRREQEWRFQVRQAELELERADRDIAAAEIRVAIAERELDNHDRQVAQSTEVDEFLRDKFSNVELYDWMSGQIATLYFQAYQLAFDLAKRAEAAYRHELAIPSSEPRIVQYGYWEDRRKGLLAGDRLAKDLRRLEKAHMERNVREYELRKNVSLAQLDAHALTQLQETGECTFTIPEEIFDLDHPGHYLRRLRAVSLSIPAKVGPYVSLGAQLALQQHWIRPAPGDSLDVQYGGQATIATSTATADAGLFQLEFSDERYLPFEHAGAVSQWRLVLPKELRQFDYRAIGDVIVTLAYTAREGGDEFRETVESNLRTAFNAKFADGATQVIAVHRAFPNEWANFLAPSESATEQVLNLPLELAHFPYFARQAGLTIERADFVMLYTEGTTDVGELALDFSTGGTPTPLGLQQTEGGAFASAGVTLASLGPATWTLSRSAAADPAAIVVSETGWLDSGKIAGLIMIVRYALEA